MLSSQPPTFGGFHWSAWEMPDEQQRPPRVRDLVEDEVMLALPLIARHASRAECGTLSPLLTDEAADINGTDSGSIWVLFSTLIAAQSTGAVLPLSSGSSYNIRYDGPAADAELSGESLENLAGFSVSSAGA